MVVAEIVTLLLYAVSIIFLPEYFGTCFQFPCKLLLLSITFRSLQTFRLSSLYGLLGRWPSSWWSALSRCT